MSKLSDLGQVLNGASIPKTNGVYPAYGGNGIITYVNQYNYSENTIIIGRVGANCGAVYFSEGKCWVTDNALAFTINDNADAYFVYNLLKMLDLNKYHIGSSQPLITQSIINNIEFGSIPQKSIQKHISQCVKAIDDKISNNNRINAELESMAKTIYDYWFTQFDFPDENGKPYKSSGGKMVWNEELKRVIPEGWGATTIGSILGDYPKTTSILRDDYGLGSKYPIIDQSKDYICGYTDDYDNVLHMNDAIVYGDHTNYTKYVNFDFARGADGTQIINSNEPALPNYILYQQILLLPVIEKGYSRHFKFLKEQYVIVPEFEVSKKYMDIVEYSLLKTKGIITENQQLASLRDWLLPMLMNGQVGFEGE